MSHREYVSDRSKREPRFQAEIVAASAELVLGEAIVNRRHERNLSLPQLSDVTGIPLERLELIEEDDALMLHEVLWLLHALDLSVSIDSEFQVSTHVHRFLGRSGG
jgi:transcriptional regulator with XRE-family HTH domain